MNPSARQYTNTHTCKHTRQGQTAVRRVHSKLLKANMILTSEVHGPDFRGTNYSRKCIQPPDLMVSMPDHAL